MSSGYLVATFDLLNVRDLDVIAQVADRCDQLVVGVLTDELVEQRRGIRPVVPLEERMRLVSGVRGVSEVRVHGDQHDHPLIFVPSDEVDLVEDADLMIMTARRQSRSEILRNVLTPALMQAVA